MKIKEIIKRMFQRYNIIIENAGDNYSAYCPDLPGCVATGKTIDEVKKNMQKAIEMHIQKSKK